MFPCSTAGGDATAGCSRSVTSSAFAGSDLQSVLERVLRNPFQKQYKRPCPICRLMVWDDGACIWEQPDVKRSWCYMGFGAECCRSCSCVLCSRCLYGPPISYEVNGVKTAFIYEAPCLSSKIIGDKQQGEIILASEVDPQNWVKLLYVPGWLLARKRDGTQLLGRNNQMEPQLVFQPSIPVGTALIAKPRESIPGRKNKSDDPLAKTLLNKRATRGTSIPMKAIAVQAKRSVPTDKASKKVCQRHAGKRMPRTRAKPMKRAVKSKSVAAFSMRAQEVHSKTKKPLKSAKKEPLKSGRVWKPESKNGAVKREMPATSARPKPERFQAVAIAKERRGKRRCFPAGSQEFPASLLKPKCKGEAPKMPPMKVGRPGGTTVAKGSRARAMVMSGRKVRTVGRLTAPDLIKNRKGKFVSKRMSAHCLRRSGELMRNWGEAVKLAREQLGITGWCPVGGATPRGQALHIRTLKLSGR